MSKLLALWALVGLALLLACGGYVSRPAASLAERDSLSPLAGTPPPLFDRSPAKPAAPAPAAAPAPRREQALSAEFAQSAKPESSAAGPKALELAERKVISTASLSVEVPDVQAATNQVRVVAESLGGFVEQLTSSGRSPEQQQASITIRVPQAQFFPALERIEALGKVRSRNLGSEDVSERFIDLKARLQSSLREEQSLLSLLGKTTTVAEVLAIERELTRVRADIERFQGQLNFLERRVDLATITVTLVPPAEERPAPPSASLEVEVTGIDGKVEQVKEMVVSRKGVVDRVRITVFDGRKEAYVTLRVFTADFKRTVDFLEDQGEVRSKKVEEAGPGTAGNPAPPEKPEAVIELAFVEESGADVTLIVAVAIVAGVLVAFVGLALYLSYRAGARRRPGAPG